MAMTPEQMDKLAQKLAKMKIGRAKGHIRSLDKNGFLEMFRNAVTTDEWYTRYALPSKGLLITLVEKKEYYGPASDLGYRTSRFKYVEARVEELPPNHYQQANRPMSAVQMAGAKR